MVDLLSNRKGQMLDMGAAVGEGTTQRVKYRIPTRGLLVRLFEGPRRWRFCGSLHLQQSALYLQQRSLLHKACLSLAALCQRTPQCLQHAELGAAFTLKQC